ncbi:MAG: hypothetical protein KDC98_09395 [Planctomycetes bacterium]|nr:hypothetical protein [Planctomycetota bacterium]
MRTFLPALVLGVALVTDLPAQFHTIGLGCGIPAPVLLPTVGTRLDSGLPYSLTCWNAPAGNPGFLAFGFAATGGIPLDAYGLPGCLLHTNPVVTVLMTSAGHTAEGTLTMPVVPGGLTLYAQAAMIAPGANAAGVVMSSAGRVVIDPWCTADEHVATAANVVSNFTVLDIPELNGAADAVFMARQLDANPKEIGVWFDPSRDRWTIFNEDGSPMPQQSRFVIMQANSRAQQFQWRAVPSNTFGHWVRIQHPALDGRPAAKVHVTKLYRSGAGIAGLHLPPIGVWYDGTHWNIFNQNFAPMPSAAAFMVLVDDDDLDSIASMTVTNTSGPDIYLGAEDAEYQQNPRAYPIVTQNWNPPGSGGVYNDSRVCADFEWIPIFQSGGWYVRNDGATAIPVGASFNVFSVDWTPQSQWYDVTHGSIFGGITIANPGMPASWYLTTLVWNPGGVAVGVYNDHEASASYLYTVGNPAYWYLGNIDGTAMPNAVSYNVVHVNRTADGRVVEASAANTIGADLVIDFAPINGDPDAVAFLQATAPATYGLSVDHPTGLVYSTSLGRWLVRNLDGAPMAAGARFILVVGNAELSSNCRWFTHTVTASNLGSSPSLTHIRHPLLDGNPSARCVVTRVVGSGGAVSQYPIGVYYSSVTNAWAIHHQALTHRMPIGARFHVLVEGT